MNGQSALPTSQTGQRVMAASSQQPNNEKNAQGQSQQPSAARTAAVGYLEGLQYARELLRAQGHTILEGDADSEAVVALLADVATKLATRIYREYHHLTGVASIGPVPGISQQGYQPRVQVDNLKRIQCAAVAIKRMNLLFPVRTAIYPSTNIPHVAVDAELPTIRHDKGVVRPAFDAPHSTMGDCWELKGAK